MEENARTTKFSGRLFGLVWIFWIATLSLVTSNSCPDPNAGEYKPCDVLLPLNKTEGINCSYTKGLTSDIPDLPLGDYRFPQCPRNLYAGIAAVDDGQNACALRLNITWQAPFDGSLDRLLGFFLNISFTFDNIPRSINRTFLLTVGDLSSTNPPISDAFFRHLCAVPVLDADYKIEIFSLPMNEKGQRNSASTSFRTYTQQPSPCQTLGYPNKTSDWRFVMWQRRYIEDSTIEVCFLTAPTSYGFTKYDISLLPLNSVNHIYVARQTLTVDPFQTASVCVNFTNACQQVYSVELHPHNDPWCTCRNGPQKPDNCVDQCYKSVLEPIDMNSSVCVSTTTFSSSRNTPNPHHPVIEQSSTQRQSGETGKIVGIVVGVAAAVVFVVVAVIIWRCTRRRSIPEKRLPPFHSEESPSFPVEHQQSVLLVYSSDNDKHRDVVRQLATFLHGCCKCDVRFDEWSQVDISQTSALDWLTRQMRQVKHVVIINSKGSFMQHQAWLDRKTYRLAAELMLPDMFVPAFRQIENTYFMNWEDPKRKLHYHHVSFPYTENKHLLDVKFGQQYKLMKHIEELFLNIHGMTKYSSSGKTFAQEINAKNYTDLPEGRQLSLAIEEACHFHLENPSWFERYFRFEEKADPVIDAPCYVSLEGSLPRMNDEDGDFMDLDCVPPSTTSSYLGDNDRRSLSLDMGMGDSIDQGSSNVQLSPITVGFCPPTEDDTSVYSYNFMEKIQEFNEQYDSGLPSSNYDIRSDRSSSV